MFKPHLLLPPFLALATFAAAQDSAVIINEIQYHPADEINETEWIELRCLHGVDVDMSGWRLEGGIDFTFPAGTVIKGRSLIVVAQDAAKLPGVTVLGSWGD